MSHPQSRAIREYARAHDMKYTTALRMVETRALTLDSGTARSLAARVPWLNPANLTPRQRGALEANLAEIGALGTPFWEYLAGTEPKGKVTVDDAEGNRTFVIKRRDEQIPGYVITTNPLYVSEELYRAANTPDETPNSYALRRRAKSKGAALRKAIKSAHEAFGRGALTPDLHERFTSAREDFATAHERWEAAFRAEAHGPLGYTISDGTAVQAEAPSIRRWPLLLDVRHPWGALLPEPEDTDVSLRDDGSVDALWVALITGQEIGVTLDGTVVLDADSGSPNPADAPNVTTPMLDDLQATLAAWSRQAKTISEWEHVGWERDALELTLGIGGLGRLGEEPDLLAIEASQAIAIAEGRESEYGPWQEWRDR